MLEEEWLAWGCSEAISDCQEALRLPTRPVVPSCTVPPRPPHNPCPQSILGLGQCFFALSRECTGGAWTGDRDITCPIAAQCLGAFTSHKNSGKLQKSCIIPFPSSYTQKLKGRGVFRADWIESNGPSHDVVALEKCGHSLAYNSVFHLWVFSCCHDAITSLREEATTLRWVHVRVHVGQAAGRWCAFEFQQTLEEIILADHFNSYLGLYALWMNKKKSSHGF